MYDGIYLFFPLLSFLNSIVREIIAVDIVRSLGEFN